MKYNHAFDIAFEVHTDNERPTAAELLAGLRARLEHLEAQYQRGINEILEACGSPFDTTEEEDN